MIEEFGPVDVDALLEAEEHASPNTVGLVHPVNGASLTLDDDGRIEMWTAGGQGLRIDTQGYMVLVSPTVSVSCNSFLVNGQPLGNTAAAVKASPVYLEILRQRLRRETDGPALER